MGEVEIDGEEYEMNARKADFFMFGGDTPAFCFYTFYKMSQIEGHTVAEYKAADRLFQIDDLDPADFE